MSDDRLVKLATLWQRRSKAGKTYFSGFMGDVSLVMFRGDEIERNGEQIQTWRLFVQERAPARRRSRSHRLCKACLIACSIRSRPRRSRTAATRCPMISKRTPDE